MSLRQLMRVIGKLGATASAFSQARLQVRYLQNDLIASQRKGKSMFQNVKLSEKSKLELHWWIENIKMQNGRPMTLREPEMIIYSDAASSWGWGAECQGQKTGGQWKKEEVDLHINILELLAAKFALKSFLSLRTVKSVHLMMDNTAAMRNIINMGGTACPLMTEITKEIYAFLTSKGITITLEYIPSALNKDADEWSRKSKDSSEWKLHAPYFQKVCQTWGQPEIDLFASRLCHQIPKYFSWRADPESMGTDALQQDWRFRFLYAFPPFSLIGRCIRKVALQRTKMILITPVWTSQSWYPNLLEMSVSQPIILPGSKHLLLDPKGQAHPLVRDGNLRVAAWLISGKIQEQLAFQKQLPDSWSPEEAKEPEAFTRPTGPNSVAGVVNGKLIQFRAL